MVSLMTSTAILLVLASHVVHFTKATCFTSRPNVILQNHVIYSLTLPHIGECWQTCKQDARCQSLNYFVENLHCEINNRTIDLAPENAVNVPYTAYFDNPHRECVYPAALGMQSTAIPDAQITASSIYDERYLPSNGRLHNSNTTWAAESQQPGEWLQVDLGSVTTVTGIATQGHPPTKTEWVQTYSLKFSVDGLNFNDYESGKMFTGNTDSTTVVKNDVKPPITARFIRVVAKTWYRYMTIRLELYGCN